MSAGVIKDVKCYDPNSGRPCGSLVGWCVWNHWIMCVGTVTAAFRCLWQQHKTDILVGKSRRLQLCLCGDQNGYFKPEHAFFRKCFFVLKPHKKFQPFSASAETFLLLFVIVTKHCRISVGDIIYCFPSEVCRWSVNLFSLFMSH